MKELKGKDIQPCTGELTGGPDLSNQPDLAHPRLHAQGRVAWQLPIWGEQISYETWAIANAQTNILWNLSKCWMRANILWDLSNCKCWMRTKLTLTHLCHSHCNCPLPLQIKWIWKMKKGIGGNIDTTLPMTLIRRVTMMGRRVGGVSIAGPAENWGLWHYWSPHSKMFLDHLVMYRPRHWWVAD